LLYSSARLFAGSACESQFSEALGALIAYRPGREVLGALDQEADREARPKPLRPLRPR